LSEGNCLKESSFRTCNVAACTRNVALTTRFIGSGFEQIHLISSVISDISYMRSTIIEHE